MDAAKSPKPSFTRIKLQSDNGNNEEKDSKAKKIPVAKYVPTSIPPPPQHGNDTEIRGEPLPVEAKIVSISGGATHLAAVDINGNLYTHGDNTYGQCGHPVSLRVDDLSSRVAERKHVKGLSRIHIGATTRIKAAKGDRPAFVVQVSCGSRHTVARTLQGGMIAFGDDRFIQLGVGDTRCVGKKLDLRTMAWMNRDAVYHEIDRHAMWQPKSVNPHTYFPGYLSEDVKMVESGGDFTLFALKDLTPVLNVEKARRENKIRDRAVGVPFGSSIEDYEAKMGILPVYLLAMGANDVGQCGTGVCGTSASKNLVKLPIGHNPVKVSCGDDHCLALMTNGKLYGWGSDQKGQIGRGGLCMVHFPKIVRLKPRSLDEQASTPDRWPEVKLLSAKFDNSFVVVDENKLTDPFATPTEHAKKYVSTFYDGIGDDDY
eukprot:GHVN01077403.1.p1 GENE.GHVN01077403.1~~GHVN01077403.1.p1  ORF type:complete len:429 (-),score=52.11 GHVN01077403.1:557-1843(-)